MDQKSEPSMWTVIKTGLTVVGFVGLAVSIYYAFESSENTKVVVAEMDKCIMQSYVRSDLAGVERCLREYQKATPTDCDRYAENGSSPLYMLSGG